MSLNEDQSSSCVHTSAKPAVPEYLGQRFALINATSRYEIPACNLLTDTADTFAGSEVSIHVKPYVPAQARDSLSQSIYSSAQREFSLGGYLFNQSNRCTGADTDWSANIIQLEPVADAQTSFSPSVGCLLPVIPHKLNPIEAKLFCSRLSVVPSSGQNSRSTKQKCSIRVSQVMLAHRGPIWTSAFSCDMSFFATAGQDGMVKIWKCRFTANDSVAGSRSLEERRTSSAKSPSLALIQPRVSGRLPCVPEDVNHENPDQHNSPGFLESPILTVSSPTVPKVRSTIGNSSNDFISSHLCIEREKSYDDESTSSLTEDEPFVPETQMKLRPAKIQLSQLSQTITLTQSTHSFVELMPTKMPIVASTLLNKGSSACAISAQEDNISPFLFPAIRTFCAHTADIVTCSWSQNNFLATGSLDKTVRIWSPIKASCLEVLVHKSPLTCVLFHPMHEKVIYTATSNGEVFQWDVVSKRTITWTAPCMVTCMVFTKNKFSPPAGVVIVGTCHGKVHILAADSLRPIFEFLACPAQRNGSITPRILALSIISETNELLISVADSQIKRYCLLSMLQVRQYKSHLMTGVLSTATPAIAMWGKVEDKQKIGRFVIIGDERGSIIIYPEEPINKQKESKMSSLNQRFKMPNWRKLEKKTHTIKGVEIVRSCLKITLPQKAVCTAINIVRSCLFIDNLRNITKKGFIVASTAKGEVFCIEI